jgi:hypothetical protein
MPMETNLDTIMQQHIDRHYKRFQNAYEKRIVRAKDKLYAIEQYEMRMKATTELRYEWNEEYQSLIKDMQDDYRLGVPVSISVKKLRKKQFNLHQYDKSNKNDKSCLIETYIDEEGIEHDIEPSEPKDEVQLLDKYSDDDIIWAFAEYKTCELFLEFLDSEKQKYTPLDNKISNSEGVITNKKQIAEFTMARQVLAIHYLMKYCQVKDVDQTAIARFIYFLTSKHHGNIYKLVRNPLKGTLLKNNEDLKFIRKYFEELEMEEVVKMINNEMV